MESKKKDNTVMKEVALKLPRKKTLQEVMDEYAINTGCKTPSDPTDKREKRIRAVDNF